MITGVVAGFGEPIGQARLAQLQAHGLRLIRQDIHGHLANVGNVHACLDEAAQHPEFQWLWIVDSSSVELVPAGSWIEYLNEPEHLTPLQYTRMLREYVLPVVQARELTLWAGSIGNLYPTSLRWLRAVLELCPQLAQVAVHRYPPGTQQRPRQAHAGYRDRSAEAAALRTILGGRRFIVSEVGYHQAPMRRCWFWKRRLSDQERDGCLLYEKDFWMAAGADALCIYQERDGAQDIPVLRYGLTHADGTWKTGTIWG